MRRQEKLSAPEEEQEPQRLVVSLSVILLGVAPSLRAWAATAASISRFASLIRKSRTLRGTKGRPAATQSSGCDPACWEEPEPIQTPPRLSGQWTISCMTPRRGMSAPGSKGIFSANPRRMARSKGLRLAEAPTRRHCQDDVLSGGAHPQREAAGGCCAPQADAVALAAMRDVKIGNVRGARRVFSRT
jgi:hypothetical protein